MLRKLIRIVVTVLGLLFGYGIYQLTSFIFAKLEITVIDDMTPMQQSMTALGFAVFFGLIFLILTPLIRRQSVRVAENIEHDLQGVSGNDILAGVIGLITGLVIALLITQIYTAITNRYLYTAITIITYLLLGYLGVVIATKKGKGMISLIIAGSRAKAQSQTPVIADVNYRPYTRWRYNMM